MTYFRDLSNYSYHSSGLCRPQAKTILWLGLGHDVPNATPYRPGGTRNVGWLGFGHDFPKAIPTEEMLDLIWEHCKISVARMRGLHDCEFCPSSDCHEADKDGEKLLLGSSEIRVFSKKGSIYAAPNLIYHYISEHCYEPPGEFLRALREGPSPPSKDYFERLERFGLEWNKTPAPIGKRRDFRLGRTAQDESDR
jgi:hypothetical protein